MRSDSDWDVLREIFLDGDYDDAIRQAINSSRGPEIRILDLGANVGFFSLRCVDLYRQAGSSKKLNVLAVEGAPSAFTDLQSRVQNFSGNGVSLTIKQGLVGLRNGTAKIYSSPFSSHTNGIVPAGGPTSHISLLGRHAESSEYLDLFSLVPETEVIDLLKCDIEGSELAFLQNYEDLLRRTRFLVIEIHPKRCDANACLKFLDTYGFTMEREILCYPTHWLRAYRGRCAA